MSNKVDARGLACPRPVIMTKKALDELKEGTVTVVVDNEVAKVNVCKLVKSNNKNFTTEQIENGDFHIKIEAGECSNENPQKEEKINKFKDETIVISTNVMGGGDDKLGKILVKGFIYTLTEMQPYPKTVIFYNAGIMLTTEGSESLDDIKKLEEEGVEILSCGTCLDFYGCADKLKVGQVTNMYSIVEKLRNTSNTITI